MKFKYRELEVKHSPSSNKKKKILRPIIPIFLVSKTTIVGYEALIDSGADYNIFDAAIADILNIKLTSGKKRQIIGLGGQKIKGYEHSVILKLSNHSYNTFVVFSKEIPPNSWGVLGNQGFFDHFKISFFYRKGIIDISHQKPN